VRLSAKKGSLLILGSWLLWTGVCAPTAAGEKPPDIDSCIRRLDPQVDVGFERVAARCPDLAQQLERSDLAAWLPKRWKDPHNDLSVAGLRQLEELATRELKATTSRYGPDLSRLHSVLELNQSQEEGTAWWARLKAWLRSVLAPARSAADDDWLSRWTAQIGVPQAVRELISYAALTAVVLLAIVILLNELRASRVLESIGLARRRTKAVGGHVRPARDRTVRGSSPAADLAALAPVDRPRWLLEAIATRVSEAPARPPSRALTLRELAKTARVPDFGDRASLMDLACAAERLRFSGREVPVGALEATLARGMALLERLTP
jgi:hypothetical protein